jgi:hypothetical protein
MSIASQNTSLYLNGFSFGFVRFMATAVFIPGMIDLKICLNVSEQMRSIMLQDGLSGIDDKAGSRMC